MRLIPLRAVAFALMLALLGACSQQSGGDGAEKAEDDANINVTAISADQVEGIGTHLYPSGLDTESGRIFLFDQGSTGEDPSTETTTVVQYDADEQMLGAVEINRTTHSADSSGHNDDLQVLSSELLDDLTDSNPTSRVILSSDGAHLSFVFPSGRADSTAEQRSDVVVLDTATGELARNATVHGIVLGQALTDDVLAVQTAQWPFPGGAGQGVINIFPLDDPTAFGSSFPSGQWLAGAGPGSLLLSPRKMIRENRGEASGPVTLTAVDTQGAEVGSIAGVDAVYRDRTIGVYNSPADAAQRSAEPPPEDKDKRALPDTSRIPIDQLAP